MIMQSSLKRWCFFELHAGNGLEIRHFEKNSNSRKCKTQGKTQNSKGKSQNSRKKRKASANFTPARLKINVKMSFGVLKRKINDVLFENIFLESAIPMEIWTKIHENPIKNCRHLANIPKNSSH